MGEEGRKECLSLSPLSLQGGGTAVALPPHSGTLPQRDHSPR